MLQEGRTTPPVLWTKLRFLLTQLGTEMTNVYNSYIFVYLRDYLPFAQKKVELLFKEKLGQPNIHLRFLRTHGLFKHSI